MEYYCIFVKAGIEERFKEKAQKEVSVIDESARFYFFTEEAWFKKAKLKNKIVRPAFPGYVFLKTQKLTNEVIHTVRHIEGFIRFLPVNEAIHKIDGDASQELINFIETGERHLMSKAVYEKTIQKAIASGDEESCETWRTVCSKTCGEDKICIRPDMRLIGRAGEEAQNQGGDHPRPQAEQGVHTQKAHHDHQQHGDDHVVGNARLHLVQQHGAVEGAGV